MKNDRNPHVAAIILAAGSGKRMESDTTKQRMTVLGKSVLFRTVSAFSSCKIISSIVVVVREDEVAWATDELSAFSKIKAIIPGGKTRAESARAGFSAISEDADFVAVHDGARCLITAENITEVISMAMIHGAASAGTYITDTVKRIGDDMISATVPREELFAAHTPQIFSRSLYAEALDNSDDIAAVTDDNMMVERLGVKVYPVDTGKQNIKLTTKEDIEYAEYIIGRRGHMSEIRVGHGYDAHRLAEGRDLILGGVKIPNSKGLLGHSDADVLTHAIMDALLGAVGLGDIGRHFPDSDDKYKGISSLLLLSEVARLISDSGYSVVNIDATLVIQSPRIAKYIDSMILNISDILGIEQGRVNVKATTEEHMGFTGREEGVSAHAVSTVKK